jgi:hypothetical protein
MDNNYIATPGCGSAYDPLQFANIALTGGDQSSPVVVIARTLQNVPLCTPFVRISAGLS